MKILSLVLLAWGTVAFGASELTFKKHGQLVKTLSLAQLEQVIPSQYFTVYEPHESHDQDYKGFPMNKLLQAVYGDGWKQTEEILFTCVDGYQPSIPGAKFTGYTSYLVFERKGDEHFRVVNRFQNNEKVDLGPFYLVWDNLKSPVLKDGGAVDWPYQIAAVDLVSFAERFPNLAPPKPSTAGVKRGFLAFRHECATCHTLNGEGGGKAPELNYPTNVTEYFKDTWLRKWISDPTSVRYNTTMPALNKDDPQWKQNLEDILAYLKAMAQNKKKPSK